MLETKKATIDGHEFAINKLPFRRSRATFARLRVSLAPCLTHLAALGKLDNLLEMDLGVLAPVVSDFLSRMDARDEEAIADELFDGARINGKPLADEAEMFFAGKLDTYYKVLWFAIKVNYGSFASALGGLISSEPGASPTKG